MLRLLPMLLILALSACGFSPMYGSMGSGISAKEGLDKVEIDMIPDHEGVILRNTLIDNFYQGGYPSSPTHRLHVEKLATAESDLDITINSEATRKQIRITARFSLIDNATNKAALVRTIYSIASYNVLGSQFTTRVSENDARESALNDLARQIENQVALYFKR